MGFADFCMDPVNNALSILPSDVYNVTAYYATCVGTNPLESSINTAEAYVLDMETALDTLLLTPQCSGNTYLINAQSIINNIQVVIANVTTETSCEPTYNQLVDVLETGLCEQSFQGIFTIWIGQYLTTSLMLVTTILGIFLGCKCISYYWLDQETRENAQVVVVGSPDRISNPAYNPNHLKETEILYSATSKA